MASTAAIRAPEGGVQAPGSIPGMLHPSDPIWPMASASMLVQSRVLDKAENIMDGHNTFALENLKAAFEFAYLSVRLSVLANGGALVAVLGFYGNVFSATNTPSAALAGSASWFVCGLVSGLVASVLAYIAQTLFFLDSRERDSNNPYSGWAERMRWATLAAIISATFGFAYGAYSTLHAAGVLG